MSIVVNEKIKNRILQYIDDNNISSDFNSSFINNALLELKNNNALDESVAEHILEKIYEKCKLIREVTQPTDEFKEQFVNLFGNFDNIPKPNEWGTFQNIDFSEEEILNSIETCFELTELDEKFLNARETRDIAKEAIKSITFIDENNIQLNEETKFQMENIKEKLQSLLGLKETKVEELQELIDQYNEKAMEIWNDFLSDPEKENDEENYLIHNFTSGSLKGSFRDKYMSTSLITNKSMGTYGNSGFGMIIKPKNIIAADSKDTYTINNSSSSDKVTIIKTPLKLPQQIETEMIETCIEVNGEILNRDKASIYSETIVDGFEIIGTYVMTSGEKELHPYYEDAVKLAEEMGVKFKELDIAQKRKKQGLKPLTPQMQKMLCKRVLSKYCKNPQYKIDMQTYINNEDEFIKLHHEEFSRRFEEIRKKTDYTVEDIEQEFRNMILEEAINSKSELNVFDEETIAHYKGFFLGKVNEEEFKYIISNRYDFNSCSTLEEFEARFAEFKNFVLDSKYFDKTEIYLNEIFKNREQLQGKEFTEEEIAEIFKMDNKSFDEILKVMQKKQEDSEFKNRISNNGTYRKQVEEVARNFKDVPKTTSQIDNNRTY